MDIINDLRAVKVSGISDSEIARRTGIPQATIWRLLNEPSASPSYRTIKKLWPFLYGDRRPAPAPDSPAPALHRNLVHDARTLTTTCTSCGVPLVGAALDSPAYRDFVDVHSRCPDPYPGMRRTEEEEGVGA
ncbi:hypothetical protein DFW101_3553 [Solidesulfovibrio carbinoliphilus subsp. oakridgensis]|uniref:Helix-turn-helix domain protein n=1 Tax=Solidesulfovibrio carbinoliphilus subsp. oakridgensis TaxID=694327 RepID=G7QCA3_9BACT|nr:hypothetical protein DFW101_3553 [Solidesulfovibrio carbinoliphilus subsp. oakridgensis]